MTTPTSGFKSSEFLTMVGTLVSIGGNFIPPQYAPMVAGVAGVYIAARTLLKTIHAMGYAQAIPDLPDTTGETK